MKYILPEPLYDSCCMFGDPSYVGWLGHAVRSVEQVEEHMHVPYDCQGLPHMLLYFLCKGRKVLKKLSTILASAVETLLHSACKETCMSKEATRRHRTPYGLPIATCKSHPQGYPLQVGYTGSLWVGEKNIPPGPLTSLQRSLCTLSSRWRACMQDSQPHLFAAICGRS